MPKEGGIIIPGELYSTLQKEFKIEWERLTFNQQQKISKLGATPANTKSSKVQVYKSVLNNYQFIASEDIDTLYSCSHASSFADNDKTVYDISSLSDGEGIDIDHDIPDDDLTANKTLHKATGTKATRTKGHKNLPKKSQFSSGVAANMLASQPLVVKNPTDDKTIGLLYTSSKQQPKNSNLKASMAMI